MHSFSRLNNPLACLLLLSLAFSAAGFAQPPPPPNAFTQYLAECEKPTTEFFGVFLANQKVGYMSSSCHFVDKAKTQLRLETHMVLRVVLGGKEVSREVLQTDVYEAKPKGKLLKSKVLMKGDGGEQSLSAEKKGAGFEVKRERPGMPADTFSPGEISQTLEDANLPFLSFLEKKPLQGKQWDWTQFKNHHIQTQLGKTQMRFAGGLQSLMQEVVQTSSENNLNASYWFDETAKLREVELAPGMRAVLEPEEIAKRLDKVDLFNLVRVVLPRALPREALQAPSVVHYTFKGFPKELALASARQQWGPLKNGLQTLRVEAAPPRNTQPLFPLADPEGGKNLQATTQIESKLPAVLTLAKKIVGKEKNAWAAAQKINRWVFQNVKKGYGVSADTTQQILKQMEGDCTEHSLLATSLLRSLGIPARRINGLVYAPQMGDATPALYWHQWTEVFVGSWVEMDPTFNEEVASAGRIALGRELETHIVQGFGQMDVVEVRYEKGGEGEGVAPPPLPPSPPLSPPPPPP